METQAQVDDWRKGLEVSLHTKLKIADGETKNFVFKDEGQIYKHPDYKPSVIFTIVVEGEEIERTWFVNAEAYGVLNQIKALGKLTGLKVSVRRTGSKKSDTRYEIKKI
jgi:hypothetical protein